MKLRYLLVVFAVALFAFGCGQAASSAQARPTKPSQAIAASQTPAQVTTQDPSSVDPSSHNPDPHFMTDPALVGKWDGVCQGPSTNGRVSFSVEFRSNGTMSISYGGQSLTGYYSVYEPNHWTDYHQGFKDYRIEGNRLFLDLYVDDHPAPNATPTVCNLNRV